MTMAIYNIPVLLFTILYLCVFVVCEVSSVKRALVLMIYPKEMQLMLSAQELSTIV